MFIDQSRIYVKGGDGGNGVIAFHREKFIPYGGPSGGDGGKGGNVFLEVDKQLNTLLSFKYKVHFKAKRGSHGQGTRKTGKNGSDIVLKVPPGTTVKDGDTGEVLFDLVSPSQRLLLARGGRGGRGNINFASPTIKAPKRAERGEPGEERWFKLELKVLADVGLIGYPNAGKSTLISKVSSAKPKIADYPFTTLVPNLGVVKLFGFKTAVFADIPGLIEGAHKGVGLGHQFLRHIERTKVLLHLLDLSSEDENQPVKNYETIRQELLLYNPSLSELPEIVVGNKIDILYSDSIIKKLSDEFRDRKIPFFPISAITGSGIKELLQFLSQEFLEFPSESRAQAKEEKVETFSIPRKYAKGFSVEKKNNTFIVKGHKIEKKVLMTYLDNEDCLFHLQKCLYSYGIVEVLEDNGINDGDTVVIADFEFTYAKDEYHKYREEN